MNPKKRCLWAKGKRVGSKGSWWKNKSGWGGPLQCVPRKNMKEVHRHKSRWRSMKMKWTQITDDKCWLHTWSFLPSFFPSFLPSLRSPLASFPPSLLPSFLLPSFPPSLLSNFPPFLLPSFPPSLLPSFLPSFPPSFLPSFPPFLLPSLFPFFLPSFLPACLPAFLPSFPPFLLSSFPPSLLSSFPPFLLPSFLPSFPPSLLPSFLPSFPPSLLSSFPPFFMVIYFFWCIYIFFDASLFFWCIFIFLMLLPIVPKEDQNPFSPRHLVEDTTVTVNVMVLDMPRKFVWRHDVTDVAHSQTFPNIGCMRSSHGYALHVDYEHCRDAGIQWSTSGLQSMCDLLHCRW